MIIEQPIAEKTDLVLPKLEPNAQPKRGVKADYFVPLGDLLGWERTPTGAKAWTSDAAIAVDLLDEDAFRLRILPNGMSQPAPTFAVVRDPATWTSDFEVAETAREIRVQTGALRLVITKAPFNLEAFRTDGSPIIERSPTSPSGFYARLNDEFVVGRSRRAGSSILGLGQKTGTLDRSGRSLILWNTDVLNPRTLREFGSEFQEGDPRRDPRSQEFDPYYISIPFYQELDESGRASGFFIDNLHRAEYDFGRPGETLIRFVGGVYDEYVFAGPSMERILEQYTGLTGRMRTPPLWALGYHHCRWHPYSQGDVLDLARTYRTRSIPCDAVWLDIDHMHGYRVFTWNPKLFPNPKATFASLKSLGFAAVTIVDPGVKSEPGYPVYDSGLEVDAFCLTEQGAIYHGQVWPGRTAFPDFARAETRDWWGDLNAKHLKVGLSGIWNDMNEPATGDIPDTAMRFDQGRYSHGVYHNGYATLMAMSTYEGISRRDPDSRPFILSRAGSAGIQRYAASWLGDNMSRWDHLAMSIPMSLGLGLSGQPFVGADIGGFGENCEPELLVRWFQAGCLGPFCRNHNDAGGADQYPWSFGPQVEALCVEALRRRYQLMPYLYTAFVRAANSGRPIMTPMLMEDPSDQSLRFIDDQYLLGPDLLVAPVIEKGARTRRVRLPAGEWFDWWTGERIGSREIEPDVPLSKIPLFVRAGAVIPMWPEVPPSTMGYNPERIDLEVFVPSEDGTYVSWLEEDDGSTRGYERGERLRTRFALTRSGDQLTLDASTEGNAYPGFARREFSIHLQGAASGRAAVQAYTEGFEWRRRLEDGNGI